jgi:putative hemolysin
MYLQESEQIDLEKVIREKNPRLLKILPEFVLRYIKYIVHEADLNNFLNSAQGVYSHDFVEKIISDFGIRITTTGLENIPRTGGCIIACNHPLGGIDGISILREVGKIRKDVKALANDLLMNLANMQDLMIPVNKHGRNDAESVRLLNNAYAAGECIMLFPAGLVSRLQNGKIRDLEWKKSFITQAVKFKQTVVPVHIAARNSAFFYTLAFLRKKIGIKANIEMFYLVDEVFRQKQKSIHLTVGAPLSYELFTGAESAGYWAGKVKEHVYSLKSGKTIF